MLRFFYSIQKRCLLPFLGNNIVFCLLVFVASLPSVSFSQSHLELISRSNTQAKGNDSHFQPVVSGNGRFVAFYSSSTNLVPDDSQEDFDYDYFVRDRINNTIERFYILDPNGDKVESCDLSGGCDIQINEDGRYITFLFKIPLGYPGSGTTTAVRLDREDENAFPMIVSPSLTNFAAEASELSISADGRFITFSSQDDDVNDNVLGKDGINYFLFDAQDNSVKQVNLNSAGEVINDFIHDVRVSSDGKFIVFSSQATNLVAGDINQQKDIFLKDISTGQIQIISKSFNGTSANGESSQPVVSRDAQTIAFISSATNLVPNSNSLEAIYITTLSDGLTAIVPQTSTGLPFGGYFDLSLSADGNFLAFGGRNPQLPNAINDANEIYLYNKIENKSFQVSISSNGLPGNGINRKAQISLDGSTVVFQSTAPNLSPLDVDPVADIYAVNVKQLIETFYTTIEPTPTAPPINPGPGGIPTTTPINLNADLVAKHIKEALAQLPNASKKLPLLSSGLSTAQKKKTKAKIKAIQTSRKSITNAMKILNSLTSAQEEEAKLVYAKFSLQQSKNAAAILKKASSKKASSKEASKQWKALKALLNELIS